jgi:hypothetical protein
MSDDPKERKATDVLLDLETKIDAMQRAINSLSFDMKLVLEAIKAKNVRLKSESGSDSKPASAAAVTAPTVTAPTVGPNIVVTHAMVYADNKPIRLGKVEIFNLDNELITSVMTNHTGKWTVTLKPGTYNIKLTKGATADKVALTHKYQINISEGQSNKDVPVIKVSV